MWQRRAKGFTLLAATGVLLMLGGCRSAQEGLVAAGYAVGSLDRNPDGYAHSCRIQVLRQDSDRRLVEYVHEGSDGRKNSTPFWVKGLVEQNDYCLSDTLEVDGNKDEAMVGDNDITVWDYKGYKVLQGGYRNGKKEGVWRAWYRNRQLRRESRYEQGEQIGAQASWYPSGQKESEALYERKDGHVEGRQTFWQEKGGDYGDGSRKSHTYYRDGKQITVSREYDGAGRLINEKTYEEGRMVDWKSPSDGS